MLVLGLVFGGVFGLVEPPRPGRGDARRRHEGAAIGLVGVCSSSSSARSATPSSASSAAPWRPWSTTSRPASSAASRWNWTPNDSSHLPACPAPAGATRIDESNGRRTWNDGPGPGQTAGPRPVTMDTQSDADRPRLQHDRRAGGRGVHRPGRLRRRGQQAVAPRRRPDAPGQPPGRHGQHPGPLRRRRLDQEDVPPEGHRQRPDGRQADQQAGRRRRRLRPAEPRLLVPAAQEGRPPGHPHGHPLEVPGRPGDHPRRPGPRARAEDQAGRPGPPRDPPARPGRRGQPTPVEGETKGEALRPDPRRPLAADRHAPTTTRRSTRAPATSRA